MSDYEIIFNMPVGKRIQDSIEPVNGNDYHDEAGEVETNDSYKDHDSTSDVISCPRNRVGPSHFKGNLKQYDLEINCVLKINTLKSYHKICNGKMYQQ